MEEKVQVQAVPEAAADAMPQNEEQIVLEQAVESGEVDKDYGLQDDGVYKVNLDKPLNTEENAIKSEKQRKYLWMFHPKIAKRWTAKYGSNPVKKKLKKKK